MGLFMLGFGCGVLTLAVGYLAARAVAKRRAPGPDLARICAWEWEYPPVG